MVHFWAQSYDYNIYSDLLWEQIECDVASECLIMLCKFTDLLHSHLILMTQANSL